MKTAIPIDSRKYKRLLRPNGKLKDIHAFYEARFRLISCRYHEYGSILAFMQSTTSTWASPSLENPYGQPLATVDRTSIGKRVASWYNPFGRFLRYGPGSRFLWWAHTGLLEITAGARQQEVTPRTRARARESNRNIDANCNCVAQSELLSSRSKPTSTIPRWPPKGEVYWPQSRSGE